jgi:hypothetical protein
MKFPSAITDKYDKAINNRRNFSTFSATAIKTLILIKSKSILYWQPSTYIAR